MTTPLKVIPQTITTRTSDEQLDGLLELQNGTSKLFEDLPDTIKVDKFTQYPDRSKEGVSVGKVQVTENSDHTQNKDIKQIYEIPFTVIEVPLEAEMNVPNIPVGTKIETIDVYDFIDTVYYDGEELNRNEYTAKFVEEPSVEHGVAGFFIFPE